MPPKVITLGTFTTSLTNFPIFKTSLKGIISNADVIFIACPKSHSILSATVKASSTINNFSLNPSEYLTLYPAFTNTLYISSILTFKGSVNGFLGLVPIIS